MTELDLFDRQLADALRAYAGEAPTIQDPAAFATAIARENPRRARWLSMPAHPVARRLTWITIAVALLLASLLLLAGAGAFRVEPPLPMPEELFGDHSATVQAAGERVPGGVYTLDLNDASLLHGPGGEPLQWAGAARAVTPTPTGGLELTVRAPWPCGDAQYAFRLTGDDPEPSAGPSASGGNPTPDPALSALQRLDQGEPFRLVPVSDSCRDRFQILTSGPWDRPTVELASGETYEATDFTEPLVFGLPGNRPELRLFMRTSRKGRLGIGSGAEGRIILLDDVEVGADPCRPDRGRLADIPATPAAVDAWLRSSTGLKVGVPQPIQVDGRSGLLLPVEQLDCPGESAPLDSIIFPIGSRIYAIPTGDDLIVVSAWSYGMQDFETFTDDLVRSIHFK
ncbi:MAG TPA: hypothetical protein VFV72_02660 [Candidatus Limnocylindrales bacterium]|nr:hypothetical protein [Candidatus Limnocylindrales bacterium]